MSVYADWTGLSTATKIGTLRAETLRGKEVFTFDYTAEWLRSMPNQHMTISVIMVSY